MKNVIAFKAAATIKRPMPAKTNGSASAEILFFTGVRYVREEAEPAPSKSKPRRAKLAGRDERLQA